MKSLLTSTMTTTFNCMVLGVSLSSKISFNFEKCIFSLNFVLNLLVKNSTITFVQYAVKCTIYNNYIQLQSIRSIHDHRRE